ncbi:hypothetical protein BD324DRAFT_648883 [Kockovaella imperatae]|uniref:Uncharacterized protein n=1 Tax=Kockovaella imperatae TaxID=4999 RepID=A0A1Y1UQN3_9TREE|nr:hypothetical protein BD324DRAFT_648883 [Kockovaella imperatae]ORX40299.1 hypothetical protein BD324DRAFT_648883 [Kockovaella imperatae]
MGGAKGLIEVVDGSEMTGDDVGAHGIPNEFHPSSERDTTGDESPSSRQRLDVEDDAARQARLGKIFSELSASPRAGQAAFTAVIDQDRRTFAVPPSDALARVKAFLPMLQSSNADLLARARSDPQAVNMEDTDGDDKVVAMDLGLGVFDVNDHQGGDFGPEVERDDWQADEESDEDDEASDAGRHPPVQTMGEITADAASRDARSYANEEAPQHSIGFGRVGEAQGTAAPNASHANRLMTAENGVPPYLDSHGETVDGAVTSDDTFSESHSSTEDDSSDSEDDGESTDTPDR